MSDMTQVSTPENNPSSAASTIDTHLDQLLAKQQAFFRSGKTLPHAFRDDALHRFLNTLKRKQQLLLDALHADLRKCEFEAYATEIGYLMQETRETLDQLPKWMKAKGNLISPIAVAVSRSKRHYQPLGLTLIIAPWNYPVQLGLAPLIGSIAAGNVSVLKPSELAPASSEAVAEVIAEAFDEEHVAAVQGDVEVSQRLLARPWDHIFFTGGTTVGKIVARAGAEHLSRVTLELGGKSPAIVTQSADLPTAAKRIAWGKFVNAGQTCIAPDYCLVQEPVYDRFIELLQSAIEEFYGANPQQSPDLARIISERHFDRLANLIDNEKVVCGGTTDRDDLYIAPTVLRDITLDDKVMSDEIFGPILPVMKIAAVDEAVDIIYQRRNPLALYLFTTEAADEELIVDRVSFGGGCINNTLAHFGDPNLPFGGVGNSGLGAYHGHYSFETFSHCKGVLKTYNFVDPSVKYPPYQGKMGLLRRLVR